VEADPLLFNLMELQAAVAVDQLAHGELEDQPALVDQLALVVHGELEDQPALVDQLALAVHGELEDQLAMVYLLVLVDQLALAVAVHGELEDQPALVDQLAMAVHGELEDQLAMVHLLALEDQLALAAPELLVLGEAHLVQIPGMEEALGVLIRAPHGALQMVEATVGTPTQEIIGTPTQIIGVVLETLELPTLMELQEVHLPGAVGAPGAVAQIT